MRLTPKASSTQIIIRSTKWRSSPGCSAEPPEVHKHAVIAVREPMAQRRPGLYEDRWQLTETRLRCSPTGTHVGVNCTGFLHTVCLLNYTSLLMTTITATQRAWWRTFCSNYSFLMITHLKAGGSSKAAGVFKPFTVDISTNSAMPGIRISGSF